MKKAYTAKDLEQVRKQYDANFEKLMASVGKPGQSKYLKIERKLHVLNVAIQKDLGVYIEGPNCPSINMQCTECLNDTCYAKNI